MVEDIRSELYYTSEHEWVSIKGRKARIGISDHAQAALGDITFIELPAVGDSADMGEIIANVESVKAASDVYSPVTGNVSAVNAALNDKPELLNSAPYDEGWICEVELSEDIDKDELMNAKAYKEYLETL